MPRVRLLDLEVVTSDVAVRLLDLSVTTTVADPIRARLLDLRVTTVPRPRVQLLDLSVTTVVDLTSNAGVDQTVDALQRVYLNGLASGGWPTGFHWEQAAGPLVALEPSADSPNPSFIAPATDEGTVCSFELTVSDGANVDTTPDPIEVTVRPHIDWIDLNGELWPFRDYILDGEAD